MKDQALQSDATAYRTLVSSGVPKGGIGGPEPPPPILLKYCPRDLSKNDIKLMGGG